MNAHMKPSAIVNIPCQRLRYKPFCKPCPKLVNLSVNNNLDVIFSVITAVYYNYLKRCLFPGSRREQQYRRYTPGQREGSHGRGLRLRKTLRHLHMCRHLGYRNRNISALLSLCARYNNNQYTF